MNETIFVSQVEAKKYPMSYTEARLFHFFPLPNTKFLPILFGFYPYIKKKFYREKLTDLFYWQASRKIKRHWHHVHICPAYDLFGMPDRFFDLARFKIASYLLKYKISADPYESPAEQDILIKDKDQLLRICYA